MYGQVGAIAGVFFSGMLSDLIGGKLVFTSLIFSTFCIPMICCLPMTLESSTKFAYFNYIIEYIVQLLPSTSTAVEGKLGVTSFYQLALIFFGIGFFINGPKTLLAMAVRESVPPKVSGTATGFLGLLGQVGSVIAGAPFGTLIEKYGWWIFPWTLVLAMTVCSLLLLLSLMTHTSQKSMKKNE